MQDKRFSIHFKLNNELCWRRQRRAPPTHLHTHTLTVSKTGQFSENCRKHWKVESLIAHLGWHLHTHTHGHPFFLHLIARLQYECFENFIKRTSVMFCFWPKWNCILERISCIQNRVLCHSFVLFCIKSFQEDEYIHLCAAWMCGHGRRDGWNVNVD